MTDITPYLAVEGRAITLSFTYTSPTTATLTWNIPKKFKAYNGILVTISPLEYNPSMWPTDGQRYTASQNFAAPVNTIGAAVVVWAGYGDTTTLSVDVTGLTANTVYFASAHVVSNTLLYYTEGMRSYVSSPASEASPYAGDVPTSTSPPLNPVAGQIYYDPIQNIVFMWNATTSMWIATQSNNTITGPYDPPAEGYAEMIDYENEATTDGDINLGNDEDPDNDVLTPPYISDYDPYSPPPTSIPLDYPRIGDFFYNTLQKKLKIWTGTQWNLAETVPGVPMYEKVGVGKTNSNSARAKMVQKLKAMMGWPVVCVELTEDQFDIAIDNALQEVRRRTDTAYFKQYFFMHVHYDQDSYYLNDPSVGTNGIVDVLKIHRLNQMGLANFTPDNIYAQQFLNQFYAPGVGYDLVSIHLISSLANTYSLLFAGEINFNWRESTRELKLYKRIAREEKVLLETSCEKTEDEILTDRWMQQWVQQWAEAELMIMLGRIRGKYSNLPGPGGGLQLNADSLIQEGNALQEECRQQIINMEVGQQGPDNWHMPFAIG